MILNILDKQKIYIFLRFYSYSANLWRCNTSLRIVFRGNLLPKYTKGLRPNDPITKPVSFTSEHGEGYFIHVFGNPHYADDEFNGEVAYGRIPAVYGGMGASRRSFHLYDPGVLARSWLAFIQDGETQHAIGAFCRDVCVELLLHWRPFESGFGDRFSNHVYGAVNGYSALVSLSR
jgi:hypothetical protein